MLVALAADDSVGTVATGVAVLSTGFAVGLIAGLSVGLWVALEQAAEKSMIHARTIRNKMSCFIALLLIGRLDSPALM